MFPLRKVLTISKHGFILKAPTAKRNEKEVLELARKQKRRRYPELKALKGRVREMGTSYRRLASDIGMAQNTLSDKFNGFSAIRVPEMEKIAAFLNIDPVDVPRFFMPTYCETQHSRRV